MLRPGKVNRLLLAELACRAHRQQREIGGQGEAFDAETRLPQTMARQILDVSCHCRVTHNGTIGLGVTKIAKVRFSAAG